MQKGGFKKRVKISPIAGRPKDEVRQTSSSTSRSVDPITGWPIIEKKTVDFSNPTAWKNRRRMAWTSMVMMVTVTLTLLFVPDFVIRDVRIQILMDVLGWFYMAMATVIGAYMGTTTWATKK